MAVKVQSTIEPYNDSYDVVNAKHVGVGEGENKKKLSDILNNLPSGGGSAELPIFDLVALGLSPIEIGKGQTLNVDTTEIMAALDKGLVTFGIDIVRESGTIHYNVTTNMLNANGKYFCYYTGSNSNEQETISIAIGTGIIIAGVNVTPIGGSVAPHIGDNGNWFIGDTDTGVKAAGENGKDGVDGKDGANGTNGKDGVTPHIGANGNWFIGDTDTGVAAGGNGGGVSSWNDLTDKPFGEVVETIEPITWDGNTEGLLEVTPEGFDYGVRFYKVSDRIFSIEQLKSMIYSTFSDEVDYEDEEYTYLIGDELEGLILAGLITEDIFDLWGEVCIVRKPGATETSYGSTFPETGVYFYRQTSENGRVSYANSLYIEGNSFVATKQLDNKYLEPFEGITEEDLLPSDVDQTFLHNLGVFAISSKTTEEMFWKWQEGIKGNVFVEFDGVTYECSPQRLAAMDNGMAVGNCTNFGGTGNGEPFIVTIMPDIDANGVATGAYYWAIVALTDTAPTEHQYRVYQPYDEPKYMLKESHLPFDAIAAYIDNYIDEALGGDY